MVDKENYDILKSSNITNPEKITINKNLFNDDNKLRNEKPENFKISSEFDVEQEEDDNHHSNSNTLEHAKEILQKFKKGNNIKIFENDEDEEDEDLDDYIKNLENKA